MDVNSKESKVAPFLASCQDWSMVRSIFVQSVFWRVAATLSWALVSLLTLKLFRRHLSLELYGLVGPALQVLGSLPALDGGFRATLNRRMLSAGAGVESDALAAFGQRLYSRLALTATGLGLLLLATYSFTPNAQLMQLPWPFFPLLGSCCGLVVLASSFLQQMTGVGLQRRMFILQLIMAWTSLGRFSVRGRLLVFPSFSRCAAADFYPPRCPDASTSIAQPLHPRFFLDSSGYILSESPLARVFRRDENAV